VGKIVEKAVCSSLDDIVFRVPN